MKPMSPHGHDLVRGGPTASPTPARPAAVIALLILGYSGYLKSSPSLSWLALDLTVLSALVVLFVVATRMASGRRPLAGFGAVVLLWCAWLPGVAIAVGSQVDQYKVLLLYTVTALCAIAPFLLFTDDRSERYWINGHVVCAAVFAAALLLFPSDAPQDVYSEQLNLEGGNTISSARLVGAGVLIAFLGALQATRVWSRTVLWVFAIGGAVVIAAIGSRGPFLALIVAGLGTVLLSGVFVGQRLRVAAWSATAVAGLLYYVFEWGGTLNERIGLLLSQGGDEARQWLYRAALLSIETNPFGIGWGGFGRIPSVLDVVGGGGGAYPHNLFLEVFVEGGIVAGAALLVFVSYALMRTSRISGDPTGAILFALTIYWLVAAQTSSDINSNRMTWVALAVGLAAQARRRARSGSPEHAQPVGKGA